MKHFTKNKKLFIAGGSLIVAAIIIVIGIFSSAISVESSIVEKNEVIKLIKESGSVESENSIMVTAKNNGEIESVDVSEADEVNAGDTLMIVNGTSAELDIKSLQAKLSGLQAQYSQARNTENKNKTLYEQGALSYDEYYKSNIASKQISSQLTALNYSIQSFVESAGASVVKAPIDGVVTGVFMKQGENVVIGNQLFEISNLNDIYVKVNLIAEDADLVKVGDKVKVYNEDSNFFDNNCTVKKVHLKAQEKMSDLGVNQKRVIVEVSLSEDNYPRLGSDVDVEITLEHKDNVLRISDMAIFEMDYKNYVYVVEKSKAILREVKIGIEGEDFTEIISGLSEGEEVIISPDEDIQEGVRVSISEEI